MSISIRPIQTHAEYRAVEQLQCDVWSLPDVEVVPTHLLLTAAKNGGLLLGAFDGDVLTGFVFGFPGLTPSGRLKHCSHMAGVLPAYQSQHIGYRLKLAQRAHVLAQGIDLITWTFDPLESRNAQLNFRKLGVTCNTYLRNLYGEMRDGLNTGLPSDRFQVDWWIASEQVERRLRGEHAPPPSISPLTGGRAGNAGEHSLSPWESAGSAAEASLPPSDSLSPWESARSAAEATISPSDSLAPRERVGVRVNPLQIAIPSNFQAIKSADMALAVQWRMNTRQQFEDAFGNGWTAVDIIRQDDICYYLLEPGAS